MSGNKVNIGKDKKFEVNDKTDEKKKYEIKVKQESVDFPDGKDEADLKVDWKVIVDKEGKKVEKPEASDKGEDVTIKVKFDKGTFSDGIKIEGIDDKKRFKDPKALSGSFKAIFWIMWVVIAVLVVGLIWWWVASSKKEDKEEESL